MVLPLEVLTARRRLCSKSPVVRPCAGVVDGRSNSAFRFSGLTADGGLMTPLVLGLAGSVVSVIGFFGRESCVIRGEEDELDAELFWLEERLRLCMSDALVGGDEPRGDGF